MVHQNIDYCIWSNILVTSTYDLKVKALLQVPNAREYKCLAAPPLSSSRALICFGG